MHSPAIIILPELRHWRIMIIMVIVETSIFTRQVLLLLTDDEYRLLQAILVNRPDAGVVIPSSGGLRKMRWGMMGRGKRGGVRVIYYWAVKYERILMLLIYPKYEKDDLTSEQLKILRKIIKEEYP
jgi:mRNA-degrading endonuclease RelE of RelBE toxin-antitoxin system